MHTDVSPKVARRLTAAEGYLELNLPNLALEELDSIEDAGLFEAPRQYMIGYARQCQGDSEGAIPAFERAARLMPSPHRRLAWKALSKCYRDCGSDDLADLADSLSKPSPATKGLTFVVPAGMKLEITLRST